MLVYGYDTQDGDMVVTEKTKKFYVAFFGFFPHDQCDDLESFIQ